MDNDSTLVTNHIVIVQFHKHIGKRIVTVEVLFRRIGKRTHLVKANQRTMLGRINRNDDKVIPIRIRAHDLKAAEERNNKGFIFIDSVRRIDNYRRPVHILDLNKYLTEDRSFLIRCINSNEYRSILLNACRNNLKRIIQSSLVKRSQDFDQRSRHVNNKCELIIIFVSEHLRKRKLERIHLVHLYRLGDIVRFKYFRRMVF